MKYLRAQFRKARAAAHRLPGSARIIYILRKLPRRAWLAGFMTFFVLVSFVAYMGRAHAQTVAAWPGTVNTNWTSYNNVKAQDNTYASASLAAGAISTLQVSNFGFNIPTGSTITAVEADIWRYAPSVNKSTIEDSSLQIMKAGVAGGTDQAVTGAWDTSNTQKPYNPGNTWGQTLAPADVNASNFGIQLVVVNTKSGGGATNTAYVDAIKVTITYTPPPTTYTQASYQLYQNQTATGMGTYLPKVDYNTGTPVAHIASADLNGDGKADMVASNSFSSGIAVYLNNGDGTFPSAATQSFTTSATVTGIALVDMSGDGKPDIVISAGTNVSWFLNNGSGTFPTTASGNFTAATTTNGVAVGDLNGDGKPDIVSANFSGANISVFMNNGLGGASTSFTVAGPYATGTGDSGVAIGDIDGDGKNDIVTNNSNNGSGTTVSVLINSGTGTFPSHTDMTTDPGPYNVALADVDGDGKTDIITTSTGLSDVAVLQNNGTLSGWPLTHYATAGVPEGLGVADVSGDGKPDIVTSNISSGNVSVLINNGSTGTVSFLGHTGHDYATGSAPSDMTLGDINGDGYLDILTANPGNSTSTLLDASAPMNVGTPLNGAGATQSTAATVPGDGQPFRLRLDIGISNADLAANAASLQLQYALLSTGYTCSAPNGAWLPVTDGSAVSYYKNTGAANGSTIAQNSADPTDGTNNDTSGVIPESYQGAGTTTFTNPTAIPKGSDGMWDFALTTNKTLQGTHYCMRIAFVSGLGSPTYNVYPEIIMPAASFDQASYRWFNPSDGTGSIFAAKQSIPGGRGQDVAVADFTGDGKPDAVFAYATGSGTGTVYEYMDVGGTLAVNGLPTYSIIGVDPLAVTTADFNGDGCPDFAAALSDDNVGVYLNQCNGTGKFTFQGEFSTGGTTVVDIVAADFNGDGKPDIATVSQFGASPGYTILTNNSTGTSFTGSFKSLTTIPQSIATADFNGDGKPDLVISLGDMTFEVFLNSSGSFSIGSVYNTGLYLNIGVTTGDFNGDGKPDVAISTGSSSVYVSLNNGSGGFGSAGVANGTNYAVGTTPYDVIAADFNGDGKPDLASANYGSSMVSILLNNGDGTFAPKVDLATDSGPEGLGVGDFNSDGKTDLVVANGNSTSISILFNAGAGYGAPVADQNKSIDVVAPNTTLRLRVDVGILNSGLPAGAQSFNLQYAIKNGSCAGSTYTDVTATSPLQWYDNPNLADGTSIGVTSNDPTDGTNTLMPQTFKESNSFTTTGTVYTGQDAEWDFSLLLASSVRPGTNICVRVAKSDDTAFTAANYLVFPGLQYGPEMKMHLRQGAWWDNNGVRQTFFLGH